MPFFFTRIGLSPAEVGIVYAGRIGTMMLFQPFTSHIAVRSGRPYLFVKAAMTLSCLCAAGLAFTHSLPTACAFMWAQAATRSATVPVLDATTMHERGAERYGRTRLWGSFGYGLAALGFASAVGTLAYDQAGALVLPVYLSVCAFLAVAMWLLPESMQMSAREDTADGRRLLDIGIVSLMVLGALHWAAVETNNLFFSLVIRERGLAPSVPGIGTFAAIICESTAFFFFARFLKRAPARFWIISALAVSIGRWLLNAFAHTASLFVVAQTLHAFSFALWWASMLTVLGQLAPGKRRSAIQGMFTAAIMAGGGALGSAISGRVLGRWGGQSMFLGAACLDVLALLVALATLRFWGRSVRPSI